MEIRRSQPSSSPSTVASFSTTEAPQHDCFFDDHIIVKVPTDPATTSIHKNAAEYKERFTAYFEEGKPALPDSNLALNKKYFVAEDITNSFETLGYEAKDKYETAKAAYEIKLAHLQSPPNTLATASEKDLTDLESLSIQYAQEASTIQLQLDRKANNNTSIPHEGILNSGVDCYLNSTLQTMRQLFLQAPRQSKERVIASLRAGEPRDDQNQLHPRPFLGAFLSGHLNATDDYAVRQLRSEVRSMVKNKDYRENIDLNSCTSKQEGDPIDYLRELLPALGGNETSFQLGTQKQKPSGEKNKTDLTNRTIPSQHLFDCSLDQDRFTEDTRMQDVIDNNFSEIKLDVLFNDTDTKPTPGLKISQKIIGVPPKSFILALKRVQTDPLAGMHATKVMPPIAGITDSIQLPAYIDQKDTNIIYNPSAIVCHLGGAAGGHYITFRKQPEDGQWYLLNDDKVEKINLAGALNSNEKLSPYYPGQDITYRELIERNAIVVTYSKGQETASV